MVAFGAAFAIFALDRWSKYLVETSLTGADTKTVIPGFFNIVRSENQGIAFGIFQDGAFHFQTAILIAVSIAVMALLTAILWRNPKSAGLALIFGGALGNVYDRIHVGRVTDFLDFYVGTYHWYTFNIADASICVGAGLLILSTL